MAVELAASAAPSGTPPETAAGLSVAEQVRLAAAGEPVVARGDHGHPDPRQDSLGLPWHAMEPEAVLQALAGPEAAAEHLRVGLRDETEVTLRRQLFGSNELAQAHSRSALSIILGNFVNPITFVLSCVLAIALAHEEWIDAVAVILVIGVNSGIGAAQELESEKAMSAIRKLGSTQPASVVRAGVLQEIPAEQLVIGDVVEIRLGNLIPADIRICEVSALEVDESLLTGESVPVPKEPRALTTGDSPAGGSGSGETSSGEGVALGDRVNIGFRQTAVTQGAGRGVVVAVGAQTEMGKIADRLSRAGSSGKSPLLRSIDRLLGILVIVGLVIGVFVAMAFDWTVDSTSLLYASAILVALLPEACVVLITVALALGSRRMAQHQVIVRKMQALEVLGKVTDVCSDKTGTLTVGKMTPGRAVFLDDIGRGLCELGVSGPALSRTAEWRTAGADEPVELRGHLAAAGAVRGFNELLRVVSLCSTSSQLVLQEDGVSLVGSGNPTEVALQELVQKASAALDLGEDAGAAAAQDTRGWLGREEMVSAPGLALLAKPGVVGPGMPRPPLEIDEELRRCWEFRGEWSFDSSVKRMSCGWLDPATGRSLVLIKGAPECVLPLCDPRQLDAELSDPQFGGRRTPLHTQLLARVQALAALGLRVLALACREDLDLRERLLPDYRRHEVEGAGPQQAAAAGTGDPEHKAAAAAEDAGALPPPIRFVGLVGLRDPPKPESRPAVRECMSAGITVRMLTGDHLITAVAIAQEIGILPADVDFFEADAEGQLHLSPRIPAGVVLTGPVLDRMSPEELDALPELPLVVARSSPESKVRVVEALHRRQRIVAMTGDGVNDSPSISEADVGIAMGITGSDVTKSVADIVLADDNFATIVYAIREGRRIFDAMSKFVYYLLSTNVGLGIAFVASLWYIVGSDDRPVLIIAPLAILVLNTLTGLGPSIGLALDREPGDLMRRPPVRHGLFTREFLVDMVVTGVIMSILMLLSFSVVSDWVGDGELGSGCNTAHAVTPANGCETAFRARSASFLTINALLVVHGYNCRHARVSAYAQSWWENRVLAWSIPLVALMHLPMIYIPGFNDRVFRLLPGGGWDWVCAVASVLIFQVAVEAYKWVKRAVLEDPTLIAEKTPNTILFAKLRRRPAR